MKKRESIKNLKRISRAKSSKFRGSEMGRLFIENYEIDQLNDIKMGKLIARIEVIIDVMIRMWKIYKGELLFIPNYEMLS